MNRARASVQVIEPVAGVSYALPVASVNYILLVASGQLDTTGRYPYVQDVVVVAESHVVNFAKVLADVSATQDQLVSEVGKSLSESATVTDVCATLLILLRTFEETATVTDANLIGFGKALVEAIEADDVSSVSVQKALSESQPIAEALRTDFNGALNDIAAMGEVITFVKSIVRVFDETVIASDNRTSSIEPAKSEVVSATDSTPVNDFGKGASETVGVTDSTTESFGKNASDAVTATDDDQVDYSKPVSEEVVAADVYNRVVVWSRSPTESVGVADAPAVDFGRPVTDSVTLSDNSVQSIGFERQFSDGVNVVGFSGVLNVLTLNTAILNDDFGIDRETIEFGKNVDETQPVLDSFDRVLDWSRTLTETITVIDDDVVDFSRPVSDSASAIDNLSSAVTYDRTFTESTSASDDVAKSIGDSVAETVSATDSFSSVVVAAIPFRLNQKLLNTSLLNGSL